MVNYGLAPPDTTTDVGRLRFLIPDSDYTAITPPADQPTWDGDFQWFSDYALLVFLESAGTVSGAYVLAVSQIADFYASEAYSITTDDLRVDLTKRAQFWRAKADAAAATLAADIFVMAPMYNSCTCYCHTDELAGWYSCGVCSCS